MKKLTLLIALAVVQFACQSEYDKVKSKIEDATKANFSTNIAKGVKIDSFYLYNLDTITPQKLLSLKFNILYQNILRLTEQTKTQNELVKLEIAQAQLLQSIDKSLFDYNKNKAESSLNELNDNKKILDLYSLRLDSINKLIPNSDSTTFLYYFAKLKSVSTLNDMTVVRDSHFYIINKDFRIEKYEGI